MNRYLMAVRHYFRGYENFEIEAENKKDAVVRAQIYVRQSSIFHGGNYNIDDIKCIKKINSKRKR